MDKKNYDENSMNMYSVTEKVIEEIKRLIKENKASESLQLLEQFGLFMKALQIFNNILPKSE